MNYVMNLDAEFGIALVERVLDERDREKAWQMWLMNYQNMDQSTFIPFSDFYDDLKHPRITERSSKEEIMARAEAIKHADQNKIRS